MRMRERIFGHGEREHQRKEGKVMGGGTLEKWRSKPAWVTYKARARLGSYYKNSPT